MPVCIEICTKHLVNSVKAKNCSLQVIGFVVKFNHNNDNKERTMTKICKQCGLEKNIEEFMLIPSEVRLETTETCND